MSPPGVRRADISGLRDLSGVLDLAAEQLAELVGTIDRIPAPTTGGYGQQRTVDAMGRFLWVWSAQVEMLRQACGQSSRGLTRAAERMEQADATAADDLAPAGPG